MYIGIDLGGTNIAAGIVEDGKIIAKASTPTGKDRPTAEIVADMADLAKRLATESGIDIAKIQAVGIGCPGTIDHKTGVVVYSNNIPMSHYNMAVEFKKHLNLPVAIDNDANCAALGEYMVSGNNAEVFVLVTIGTGIGGGVVIGGKIFHGFNGAASEPGHITLVSSGRKCTCGKQGCFEAYASATALIADTEQAMLAAPKSAMQKIAEREGKVSGRTAFEAAKVGDKAAKTVVERYVRYLADGIVSIENIFQPEIIAIGGGVSHEGDALIEPVREYVSRNGFNKYLPKTKIVAAKLANDAGIIGAAAIGACAVM